jgi:hypothetical protein
MYQIPSKLEGERFPLFKLEKLLKPKGYTIGGNWDYDQGYLDYKMANDKGYQFLKIPFTPLQGQALDYEGTAVELGTPFILSHVYQNHLDDHAYTSNISGSFNQGCFRIDCRFSYNGSFRKLSVLVASFRKQFTSFHIELVITILLLCQTATKFTKRALSIC